MMVWHVAHGSTRIREMLRLGLRNFMHSAWSYQFAKFGPIQTGTIRASDGKIFIDSGALSALKRKPAAVDWLDRQDETARLAKSVGADLVAHLDVPMERGGLRNAGLTRARALEITIRNAVAFLDVDVGKAGKVYVIQGWTVDEYDRCIKAFYDHGIPGEDGLGLGSCCMRKGNRGLWQIAEHVRKRTSDFWLHAFGVGDVGKIPRLAALGYNSVDEGNTIRAVIYHHDRILERLLTHYKGFDA